MKKQLLMVLAISASFGSFAKTNPTRARVHVPANAKPVSIHDLQGGINVAPFNTNAASTYTTPSNVARTSSSVTESTIGNTAYDLQTNSAILNRLIKHNDGTISAAWTMIAPGGASASRGTGYNYFNGTSWGPIPTARIQPNQRTGFANIVVTASGKEMDISHSSTAPGVLLTSRPAKGTGAWTSNTTVLGGVGSDTWAKAISGGANGNTVHALWNANSAGANGQESSVLYSRSTDDAVTWPILRTVLPDLDSSNYLGFGGDAYSIDTKGDTVVFVVGDFTTDLVLMRSNDNGTTWSKTIVQPFIQPLYDELVDSFPDLDGDGTSDRVEGPSGDAHVMIDRAGKVHVWWSNVLMTDTSAADQLGYFPNSLDGLLYWNDGFAAGQAPDTIAFAMDMDNNGVLDIPSTGLGGGNGMGTYRGSITQMPTSGVDANNNIYLAYQSYCEACDTTAFNTGHKHVYMIASSDQGATWSNPTDIDQSPDQLNQEDVFACVAKNVDANCIHVVYQRDGAPGHSLASNTTQAGWNTAASDIIYACITPSDILGVKSIAANSNSGLSQNNPNPSTGTTTINYAIKTNNSKVKFELMDVLGNVVYSENRGSMNAGAYNLVLNTESFSSGVYFYSLTVNNTKETKKLMVK